MNKFKPKTTIFVPFSPLILQKEFFFSSSESDKSNSIPSRIFYWNEFVDFFFYFIIIYLLIYCHSPPPTITSSYHRYAWRGNELDLTVRPYSCYKRALEKPVWALRTVARAFKYLERDSDKVSRWPTGTFFDLKFLYWIFLMAASQENSII